MATDHIESALHKLTDAADYIKTQYARTYVQWSYAEEMSNSARLALEQLGSLRRSIEEGKLYPPEPSTSGGYVAESCYCATTNYPPCSWCTRDT